MDRYMRTASYLQGFNLIELMIVLIILGIITSIAIPSYEDFVINTRREDAKAALYEVASQLEQYYAGNNNSYTGYSIGSLSSSTAEYYEISEESNTGTTYRLQAVPRSAQSKDADCGTLFLDHTGQRSASGPKGIHCWE